MRHTKANAWRSLGGESWRTATDVAGFIRDNVTPYTDGPQFLTGPTHRTQTV